MTPLGERFFRLTSASMTGLRGPDLERWGFHSPGTSLCRFVPEHLMEGAAGAGAIKDAAVQALLVLTIRGGHVTDVQILQPQSGVLPYKLRGLLMQKIVALVSDLAVQAVKPLVSALYPPFPR